MELLKEIKEFDGTQNYDNFEIREAVRAILLDESDLIPIIFVSKYGYHKLPGGGIEKGETKLEALNRECMEEIGSKIDIIGEIGEIIEYKNKRKTKQISYCYFGRIISKGKPNFTENELNQRFEVIWLSLSDAISTFQKDNPENYEGNFIKERDIAFLEEFIKKNNNGL